MGFLGVYKALYDYAPQADGELAIEEGDLLYVLEKNDDDGWWKAKKKAGAEDEDEPIGLIPHNYVEEVCNTRNGSWLQFHDFVAPSCLRAHPIGHLLIADFVGDATHTRPALLPAVVRHSRTGR